MIYVTAKGTEKREAVKYKKQGDNWLISNDDGKTYKSSLEFKDKNTMILKEPGVEFTFKKESEIGVVAIIVGIIVGIIAIAAVIFTISVILPFIIPILIVGGIAIAIWWLFF